MARKQAAEETAPADASVVEASTTGTVPAKEKKPRHPVERVIVRGGILVLFGVMLIELMASRSFNSDFTAVHEALGEGTVTESDIKRLVTRYSSVKSRPDLKANRLVATREDAYSYRGLLKRRVMYVYYGVVLRGEAEAEVLDATVEPTEFFEFKPKPGTSPAAANGQPADAAAAAAPTLPPVQPPVETPAAGQ
ncbi:MAG: hypothetical protein R3C19_26650 [Planctomycetaceae bacterium]